MLGISPAQAAQPQSSDKASTGKVSAQPEAAAKAAADKPSATSESLKPAKPAAGAAGGGAKAEPTAE